MKYLKTEFCLVLKNDETILENVEIEFRDIPYTVAKTILKNNYVYHIKVDKVIEEIEPFTISLNGYKTQLESIKKY